MIYVSSCCIRKNNITEIIRQLAESGVRNIELSGGTDYHDRIEDDLVMLQRIYGLKYTCHAYFPPHQNPFVVNLASCNDKIYKQSIEHYVHCIDMLKRIKCSVLSIHAGFLIEIGADEIGKKLSGKIVYDEEKAYDRFCTAYEKISKLCNENKISLFLENNVLNAENFKEFEYHNYMMMTDYTSIMKMKEQLEFNLLLDLGHLHVSARTLGLNYTDECEKLKGYVKWIHLSENNGIFDEHKPLKENSEIVETFRKMYGPYMNVTLETVGSIAGILSSASIVESGGLN